MADYFGQESIKISIVNCAFVLQDAQYLFDTLLPEKRAENEMALLQANMGQLKWRGLKIIDTHQGLANDLVGQVEFVAFHGADQLEQLHENSHFIRREQQWYYAEGDFLKPIKLSRNDPCFCGSGIKLKKCHPSFAG